MAAGLQAADGAGRLSGWSTAAVRLEHGGNRVRKAADGVKQYKFQALVTLFQGNDREGCATLGSAPRRMVVRGRNDETRRSQVFNALVSCDDNGPFRPGGPQLLVTLRLAGDDVTDYLAIGGHFDLWLGSDIGMGIVTRRLFV